MSYGLYDGDLKLYPKTPFFNLELMKLSTYYKNKREIVSLAPDFTPQKYTNFIVRQDYFSQEYYLRHYKNIVYGGRAFDGDKYKPLELDIECCKPDINLYNRIEPNYLYTSIDKISLNTMRRAVHLRLSLDERTIWQDFEKQIAYASNPYAIIFHDYDLNAIEDSDYIIRNLLNTLYKSESRRRIGMKFPPQANTMEEFFKWCKFLPMGTTFSLQYNGIMDSQYFEELASLTKGTSILIQSTMNVTANTTYEKFITQDIVQLMRNIPILRSYKCQIPLIFDEAFFVDKRWVQVMKLIQRYVNHIIVSLTKDGDYFPRVSSFETFYSYMHSMTRSSIWHGPTIPVREVQEAFQFVRSQNYELFTLFYQNE